MEYGGWDTHRVQMSRFESNIDDVFGAGRGLNVLSQELGSFGANDDVCYIFNTDFGPQLRGNGDYSTDHGRGNYSILVGPGVAGGVYVELFPVNEIQGNAGETRYDQQVADLEGRTALERVLAKVCNWAQAGTGNQVFPGIAAAPLENGVDPGTLFAQPRRWHAFQGRFDFANRSGEMVSDQHDRLALARYDCSTSFCAVMSIVTGGVVSTSFLAFRSA